MYFKYVNLTKLNTKWIVIAYLLRDFFLFKSWIEVFFFYLIVHVDMCIHIYIYLNISFVMLIDKYIPSNVERSSICISSYCSNIAGIFFLFFCGNNLFLFVYYTNYMCTNLKRKITFFLKNFSPSMLITPLFFSFHIQFLNYDSKA